MAISSHARRHLVAALGNLTVADEVSDVLDAVSALSTVETAALDGVTAGTVAASKAAVVDSNKDIGNFRTVCATNYDAGASGTAGTVDVFPSTASKGKIQIAAADSAGDTTTTITNASQAGARTYTVPDAGASASFVMTEGAQTINGTKTIPAIITTNLDAGANGTAGTIDVFPTTAAKGKLAISCTDQTGNTTVGLVVGAMADARTITLADPLANADILTGKMSAVARTATADGLTTGTIADAGLLQFVTVTSGDANHIVVLPTPTPGRIVILGGQGATGYELRSSAPDTIGINGGTGAGAESAIPASTLVIMICETATSWKGLQLGSDGTLAKVEVAA